jgi:hypothetical protein
MAPALLYREVNDGCEGPANSVTAASRVECGTIGAAGGTMRLRALGSDGSWG